MPKSARLSAKLDMLMTPRADRGATKKHEVVLKTTRGGVEELKGKPETRIQGPLDLSTASPVSYLYSSVLAE